MAHFTPRVPEYPMKPIEDDFTNRVSLAKTIKDAKVAVDEYRKFLYAGDIISNSNDNINTVEMDQMFGDCPSSTQNEYGEKFDLLSWLYELAFNTARKNNGRETEEQRKIEATAEKVRRRKIQGPKDLPDFLKRKFTACVPDAMSTHELWSTDPVKLFLVAEFESTYDLVLTKMGANILNSQIQSSYLFFLSVLRYSYVFLCFFRRTGFIDTHGDGTWDEAL